MDDQNQDPEVIEETAPDAEVTASDTMLQTDAIIKRYLRQMKELNAKIKEKSSMFKDSFLNDAEYHAVDEEIKQVQKKLKTAKERVTNLPVSRQAQVEIKELKEELKSAREILSSYLQKYVTETGLTTIEDDDGEVLKIVTAYKLEKEKTEK